MNSIEVNNVTKSFNDFKIDNISFNLPSGTIMGLVGENGAGKSTLINLIMNVINPDSGSISVLGMDNSSKEFENVKQDVGIVLDGAFFPDVLNAKKINKIMKYVYKNWDEKYYFDCVNKFSLPLDKIFKDFSKGMKMKLSIAVAISHKPRLLILDEATSGLDPMAREEILDLFNEFTRDENNSVLISSHIISDLEKICDYICFIHKGNIVLIDEKDSLLEKYAVAKLTEDNFLKLPTDSIVRRTKTNFGYEVLVEKCRVDSSIKLENTTLEDIIIFMSKEDI